jgi:hypothetical protein
VDEHKIPRSLLEMKMTEKVLVADHTKDNQVERCRQRRQREWRRADEIQE